MAALHAAIRWRRAGFNAADAYDLLRADPALTPEEARAFDGIGPAAERRREWVYYGLSPGDASSRSAAGVSPANARLWRACGNRPIDVLPGQWIPSQLTEGQRHVAGTRYADGDLMNAEWEDIPDPPGTRGRSARRWSGDEDPHRLTASLR